jgi:pimeloyl-ACP methyl ester carboxylesterase
MPTVFVLGADSPIPPEHGIATAALIAGARFRLEPDCGHFPWLERPGSVRAALASICR